MKILVIHGPNLNMLGIREPHIYGTMRLAEIDERLRGLADELGGVELECFQSNHEGAIVDLIQERHGTGLAGCILNPGGLTQYGVSVHDAIKAVDYPFVEVHLSNLHAREPWRGHSIISPAARGIVQGLGWRGYEAALRALVGLAREREDVA
jgi:3-dehydroquinate dehydratase II